MLTKRNIVHLWRWTQPLRLITLSFLLVIMLTWFYQALCYKLSFVKRHDRLVKPKALNRRAAVGCTFPKLELHNPIIDEFYRPIEKPNCSTNGDENWTFVKDGHFFISALAERKHGRIECDYRPFIRKDDLRVKWFQKRENISSGAKISNDFFKVECKAADGVRFEMVDAGIAQREELEEADNVRSSSPLLGLNLLILSLDSVSRLAFMRTLPKSYGYLVNELNAVVLEGYNIIGDGTPQALIPLLTGKTEMELPSTRRRDKHAKFCDVYPFIWNDFKRSGYVTLYAEEARKQTFSHRLRGFRRQPTHHYMWPFYLEMTVEPNKCYQHKVVYEYFFDYVHQFMLAYPKRPKFAFAHNDLGHNSPRTIGIMDDYFAHYLRSMNEEGVLENTIFLVMSDHGLRFGEVRQTQQGKLEERLPFVSITLPEKIRAAHPMIYRNLLTNSHRLATPFDLHSTLRSVLNFSRNVPERGISMFENEIPSERTCEDAEIEPHWCTCLDWTPFPVGEHPEWFKQMANAVLARINEATEEQRHRCALLRVERVTSVYELKPKSALMAFEKSFDVDGQQPDFSATNTTVSDVLYQISFVVTPGGNHYESTLSFSVSRQWFSSPRLGEISIINAYGDRPKCIVEMNPFLEKFCVCI